MPAGKTTKAPARINVMIEEVLKSDFLFLNIITAAIKAAGTADKTALSNNMFMKRDYYR